MTTPPRSFPHHQRLLEPYPVSQDESHRQGGACVQDRGLSEIAPPPGDLHVGWAIAVRQGHHQRPPARRHPVLQRVQGTQVVPRPRRVHVEVGQRLSQLVMDIERPFSQGRIPYPPCPQQQLSLL